MPTGLKFHWQLKNTNNFHHVLYLKEESSGWALSFIFRKDFLSFSLTFPSRALPLVADFLLRLVRRLHMDSLLLSDPLLLSHLRPSSPRRTPTFSSSLAGALLASTAARFLSLPLVASDRLKRSLTLPAAARSGGLTANSIPSKNAVYTVGEFMTKKERLHVVKPTTTVDEALENLVEHRVTGFPVIDDDWKLVGVVSDYDLLALDSISGSGRNETSLFPEADSTWKAFNEIQKLLSKTNGKVVGEVMTPAPLVVHETTNLEDAARLLLETKFRRLPVVDSAGRLVGIITRGNVVRAALHIKHANEKMSQS